MICWGDFYVQTRYFVEHDVSTLFDSKRLSLAKSFRKFQFLSLIQFCFFSKLFKEINFLCSYRVQKFLRILLWNPAFVNRICTWEFTLFCLFKAYLCFLKHIFTNPKLTCAICAMTQNVLYEVSTVPEKTSIEKCTTLNDPVNIFYRIKKKWKETLFVWGKRKYPHHVSPLPQFKRIDCCRLRARKSDPWGAFLADTSPF